MSVISEETLENHAIDVFIDCNYEYISGYEIAPGEIKSERKGYKEVFLQERFFEALKTINPDIPDEYFFEILNALKKPKSPNLLKSNQLFHDWICNGYSLTIKNENQKIGKLVKLIDFDNIDNNNFLVVNQFTVEGKKTRRPDLIVFINGIPIVVLEFKNPANVKTDIWEAFNQLQTYKEDIISLFYSNAFLVISDGMQARFGSISSNQERFMRWRTIENEQTDPLGKHRDTETLIRGMFDKKRLLQYLKHFIVFENNKSTTKKIASYHQFNAVQRAQEQIFVASSENGTKKGGVVWHTQGAGKSLEMTCLAGKIMGDQRLKNPTILIVTDRTDLDGQLFATFSASASILNDEPIQIESRKELREELNNKPSGGIIFTTLQKFNLEKGEEKFPELSSRHNIVIMCDEAHRSQYGFKGVVDQKTGKLKYGLAKALRDAFPNATFVAFTGTPLSQDDKDTQAVFGEYVSVYDIQQAVEDGATVPIYYESRLAKINLNEKVIKEIDNEVEEIFNDTIDDLQVKEKAKGRWAQLEKLVGAEPRIKQVAEDLLSHFETRKLTQPGKAMVVCMSREICVKIYKALIDLNPEWGSENINEGKVKVIMTAAPSDPAEYQPHHTSKDDRIQIEKRFKNPADSLEIVIVRDMWLTGFDVPCLTTMYIDKPMKGANLAQAIARVNRVFKDKPGGLIVDYIGIAPQLKEALATYSASKGKGAPTIDVEEAYLILLENIQIAKDYLHLVDWSDFRNEALSLIPICMDHILEQEDGKKIFCDTVLKITKAFALCGTLDKVKELTDEIAFLQAVRAPLVKLDNKGGIGDYRNTDFELQQLVSKALVADNVTDIFKLAGINNPDISILSEEFLNEVKKMPQKNLAIELLNRLINDEVKSKFRTNIVKQRKFSELLQNSLSKYLNRNIEAAQVIEELIEMAKDFKKELEKEESMDLNPAEKAFYDALSNNSSAEKLMGEEILLQMANEIAEKLRSNLTVDWEIKENVRAKLRNLVRTLLKRYKYPPDQQEEAIELVLQQAEVVSQEMMADI